MRVRPYLLAFFLLSQLVVLNAVAQDRRVDTFVVYFDFAKATLSPEEMMRLDSICRNILANDTLSIYGYTDTVGTQAYNQRLSVLRAEHVGGHIKGRLPGTVFLKMMGMGEQTVAGKEPDRRVEIIHFARPPLVPVPAPADSVTTQPAPATDAAKPDTIITLTDINFVEDRAILTEVSRFTMPTYVDLLKKYKDEYFEILGHCNSTIPNLSTKDPLFILSVKRAKFIFDYLVSEGFDPNKLTYKGMGNTQPIYEHPYTSEQAHANMRVEIRVFRIPPPAP